MDRVNDSTKMCIDALRLAKTDTEKFAALSLITKIVKSQDCDRERRKEIFDAIGFDFISRLLSTKEVPEGCPSYIYQAIALTLLAYFCMEPELAQDPQILLKVDEITDFILNAGSTEDEKLMVADAIQCLEAISSVSAGKQTILERDVITKLCKAAEQHKLNHEDGLKLLLTLVSTIGPECWQKHPEAFHELMNKFANDFVSDNSEKKFDLCQKLVSIMYSFPKALANNCESAKWATDIHQGLSDILFSKVPVPHMEPALKLGALMTEKLGVRWALGYTQQSKQFFLIFVHLVCIEVRMITEDRTLDQVLDDGSLLTACFSALETVISFLVINESALDLDQQQKQQLYSAVTSAMNAVVSLLSNVPCTLPLSLHDLDEGKRQILFAIVRVTGAWLAEETAALREEVYETLPFIMKVASHSFELVLSGQSDIDVMRFLLPGLCHLTAEDKARLLLVEMKFQKFLLDYFIYNWKMFMKHEKSNEYETVIVTICGICMNLVVLEGNLVATDPTFHEFLQCILKSLPGLEHGIQHLVLTGNLAVLGLLLLRHYTNKIKACETAVYRYLTSSIKFLWDAHNVDDSHDANTLSVAHDYKKIWTQVMELWFLGMQALSTLLPKMPWITQFIVESGWTGVIIDTLIRIPEGAIDASTKSAYEHLLCCLVNNGQNVAHSLKNQGALQACTIHKLSELHPLLFHSN
uniref:Neurochondrin-like protein n=1 Tax=Scolopendra viridis TaxID=118503 RepID=A0A4D5RA89_SCOVI